MTTHYEGCYDSGPKHYECALLEVKRLRGESAAQLDELHKISDALGTNEGHSSVSHIKALLEVKRLRGEARLNIGCLGMPVNVAVSPRREWVGLTDEEKHDCYLKIDVWCRCVEAIEAKLREKNGG